MNVENRRCIRRLALRSFRYAGRRNLVAVGAVALTAMLFTAIFTCSMSAYKSFQLFQAKLNWRAASGSIFSNLSPETAAGMLAMLALICVSGYLVIYNVFRISVGSDVRYYGLLKTIGVTPRQLRRIIRKESDIVWLMGLPIGLLGGYGVGALISPGMVRTINSMVDTVSISFSPWIFLLAAVFTWITVRLSCMRPARLAARVSPVESVRYMDLDERSGKKRHRHSHRRLSAFRMAAASVTEKKGRTAVILISLALSIVLFSMLVIIVRGFDAETYLRSNCCADFVIGTSDYFQSDADMSPALPGKVQTQLTQLTKEIRTKNYGSAYTISNDQKMYTWMDRKTWKKISESKGETPDDRKAAWEHAPVRGDLLGNETLIEALDPALFGKLRVVKGNLSGVRDPGSHEVAIVIDEDDEGVPVDMDTLPAIGSKLNVTYTTKSGSGRGSRDLTYTVAAYVAVPSQMSLRFDEAAYRMIMPEEMLKLDSGRDGKMIFSLFDTADKASTAKAEKRIGKIVQGNRNIKYESRRNIRREFDSYRNMYLYVGGLLCIVIALIGTLNFFNVILTGILSRKKEFAVLQAVGMTNRQLRKMLTMEGMMYTIGAVILAAAVLLAVYAPVSSAMRSMIFYLDPHFTVLPLAAAVPVCLLLGWCIPRAVYRSSMKESIVDRIREGSAA